MIYVTEELVRMKCCGEEEKATRIIFHSDRDASGIYYRSIKNVVKHIVDTPV